MIYGIYIKISCCDVCGSDVRGVFILNALPWCCVAQVHTNTGGWGAPHLIISVISRLLSCLFLKYLYGKLVIPGHEIAGKAVRVGPKVTTEGW